MAKNNRSGQAAVLTETQLNRVRKNLKAKHHKLIFDIARYTGERAGAIVQLQVRDVFDGQGQPREEITFRAQTRKARPGGQRETRQVWVNEALKERLEAYSPPSDSVWLFPGLKAGHLSWSAFDKALRRAICKAKLAHVGISTHSFRRTAATRIAGQFDAKTLQQTIGWKDARNALRYVEVDQRRVRSALSIL